MLIIKIHLSSPIFPIGLPLSTARLAADHSRPALQSWFIQRVGWENWNRKAPELMVNNMVHWFPGGIGGPGMPCGNLPQSFGMQGISVRNHFEKVAKTRMEFFQVRNSQSSPKKVGVSWIFMVFPLQKRLVFPHTLRPPMASGAGGLPSGAMGVSKNGGWCQVMWMFRFTPWILQ